MAAAPGDTVYCIGDGWGVDREDVEFRPGGNIVPAGSTKEISDTRVSQDLDKTFSSEMSPHEGLRMGVSNPGLTRQKRREGRNILRSRKKKNLTKETTYEPLDEQTKLEQLRLKEGIFLDSLDPETYAKYIDDVARVQSGIKKLGGYMPIPLGIKSRYTDSQLTVLGFQLLPEEEQRIQKEREADPEAYSKRIMGMSRREMVGNIVPALDDWEANGGMLFVNTEVSSPKRTTGGRRDLRDMNVRILRFTTYHELWHLLHGDKIRKEDGV
ncbi:hypothetical protein H072_8103 [Dactylellina haptotyla CBS 200.50]|uniref:Uncharacterized protein n=1 Tax=Dactylellina haptotyla (strain CBS 200.50) TaxID=1284197 RepID=S8A5A9_DACHA|nr:hypothetical protein H072_8103 [Dactylellina haptotyla CBS 200.50]